MTGTYDRARKAGGTRNGGKTVRASTIYRTLRHSLPLLLLSPDI
jgi:hypothetical protein